MPVVDFSYCWYFCEICARNAGFRELVSAGKKNTFFCTRLFVLEVGIYDIARNKG